MIQVFKQISSGLLGLSASVVRTTRLIWGFTLLKMAKWQPFWISLNIYCIWSRSIQTH